MEDPDWLKVLSVFYEENLGYEVGAANTTHVPKKMQEKLETVDDVQSELQKLKTAGLLEVQKEHLPHTNDTAHFVTISQKGFEVVYEHDLKTNQAQNNRVVAALTIVLAISAAIQVTVSLFTPGYQESMLLLGFLALTILFVLYYLKDIVLPSYTKSLNLMLSD